jgi:hypothetical protein
MTSRKSQAEIIGFHLGWDISDVRDSVYQPTRYSSPKIYSCGPTDYMAATPSGKRPSGATARDFEWTPVASYYDWTVYSGAGRE